MQSISVIHKYQTNTKGITNGVAYDTAWTARVTDESGDPVFPECVHWLVTNQHPDGSWGSHVVVYHDRILSTLSALMALKEINKSMYEPYIRKGETYIWENIKNLELDSTRLIGSELLIPSLMEQAESLGLNLPYYKAVYQKEYDTKLNQVDASLLYSPVTPLSFSLEFLGDAVDVNRLSRMQLPNGSVATSPAATAFFLKHVKSQKAVAYLKKVLSITRDGSVMTVYPIEVFECGWSLYNLMLAGLYFERYTEICDFLVSHLGHSGICWSVESPVTSADETAVVCKVLCDMQYPVNVEILDTYNTVDYYLTLPFELDPSVSTNIHVLDFVKSSQCDEKEDIIEKIIRFLKKKMRSGFWTDKWHVSPYYPTAHAVFALCDVEPSLAEKAVSWIVDTQNETGLWGKYEALEETAYAVQALMYYRTLEHFCTERISTAVSVLNSTGIQVPDLVNLWVGKVLYTPIRVVWSCVASAQFMARAGCPLNVCGGESSVI